MAHTKSRAKLLQSLQEAGLGKAAACTVLEMLERGDKAGAFALLHAHREKLLKRFHECRERIDCVDFLVYQLQNSNDAKIRF